MTAAYPRLVIAGTGGDSGKTMVSLALARAARARGLDVAAFKKGPDYIDAAWLGWASGREARNLDTHLMGGEESKASFVRNGSPEGLNVIEGNRGLFDGMDAAGTHSTASLAGLLGAPVVLVVPVTKVTASIAAVVHGFSTLDPSVEVAGVVLNAVGTARQERVIREAVANRTGVRVLGAVPRLGGAGLLPERHLGLVPLHERDDLDRVASTLDEVADRLDLEEMIGVARTAPPVRAPAVPRHPGRATVRVGVFRDPAFSFYYPDNLEALESAGAELVFVSPLEDERLPDLDALYLGGGFPETHAERLSANTSMLALVHGAAERGLPVYAECGGLMYLSRAIQWRGETYPMAGVLDFDTEVVDRPQGHGYSEVVADRENPFFELGTRLKGHEFHYSRIISPGEGLNTAFEVVRGHGCTGGRCGMTSHNVLATYVHVHALGEPGWADAIVRAASEYRAGS